MRAKLTYSNLQVSVVREFSMSKFSSTKLCLKDFWLNSVLIKLATAKAVMTSQNSKLKSQQTFQFGLLTFAIPVLTKFFESMHYLCLADRCLL